METNKSNKGLETLEVWQKAIDFAVSVCREIVPKFPNEEKWALSQQTRRSVESIPANIAEGYGRYHYLDNIRFCYIARGSLEETYSHLTLAYKLGYISDELYSKTVGDVRRIRQVLNGYIHFLKESKTGINELPGPSSIHEEPALYLTDSEDE